MGEMNGAGSASTGPADGTAAAGGSADTAPAPVGDPMAALSAPDRGTALVESLPPDVHANGLPYGVRTASTMITEATDRTARIEDWSGTVGDSLATARQMRALHEAGEVAVVFTQWAGDRQDSVTGLRNGYAYVAEMVSPDYPAIRVTDPRQAHSVTPMTSRMFTDAISPLVVVVGPPGSRAG
jgi:hypothetical protein